MPSPLGEVARCGRDGEGKRNSISYEGFVFEETLYTIPRRIPFAIPRKTGGK